MLKENKVANYLISCIFLKIVLYFSESCSNLCKTCCQHAVSCRGWPHHHHGPACFSDPGNYKFFPAVSGGSTELRRKANITSVLLFLFLFFFSLFFLCSEVQFSGFRRGFDHLKTLMIILTISLFLINPASWKSPDLLEWFCRQYECPYVNLFSGTFQV